MGFRHWWASPEHQGPGLGTVAIVQPPNFANSDQCCLLSERRIPCTIDGNSFAARNVIYVMSRILRTYEFAIGISDACCGVAQKIEIKKFIRRRAGRALQLINSHARRPSKNEDWRGSRARSRKRISSARVCNAPATWRHFRILIERGCVVHHVLSFRPNRGEIEVSHEEAPDLLELFRCCVISCSMCPAQFLL